MHILIKTKVNSHYRAVAAGFTQELFLRLNPPIPPVKLLRFDGCRKGDVVSLQLNFIFFKQRWNSLIVEDGASGQEIYFIDEGTQLPFFLAYWRHRHRIIASGKDSCIVDDIHYKTPLRLLDYLMYPFMWGLFMYRKPVYKWIFRAVSN